MAYITDYHIHSTFSDGKAPPEAYLEPAINAGISEIGFSEHLALFSVDQDWVMDPRNVSEYCRYLDNLRNSTDKIIVRTGLEIDYIKGKEKETGDFLDRLDLDYRIGSVHYLGEKTVDESPGFYTGKDFDRLFEEYFEMVNCAVSSGLFDIIGHCDLIRIFGFRPSYNPEPYYRKLAGTMKKYDMVFEVNTNGRNKPVSDFYPDRRYLRIFSEEKVAVCVNSDAHMPERVGQYFDEAYKLLKDNGFKEMAVFSGRERKMIPFCFTNSYLRH